MRDLSKAVKASLKYKLHTDSSVQQMINYICESFSVSPVETDPFSPWIEFHSARTNRLAILMHKKYRLAFVLSELTFHNQEFHVEYTDDFNNAEWFINDIDVFNSDFPYMHWNEPESIVDPNLFDLMDLRFATE